ncbi:hypothetical protein Q671_04060 [Halomonas sp. PBN3]|nr:hypothetical protein Q671_04060 [Halomonas sp. PBN3]
MNAQLPGIPEGLDHLWLLGQVLVLAILDVPLVRERLEVGAVLDAVGRVDIDHLHLPGHALLLQHGVHHQQGIAGDQAVGPVALVLVEVDGLAQRQVLEGGVEHVGLEGAATLLARLHTLLHLAEDGGRVDTFVNVQGDGIHLEAGALGLAGPLQVGRLPTLELLERSLHLLLVTGGQSIVDQRLNLGTVGGGVKLQLGIEMRVVGPGGGLLYPITGGIHHAHMGVVLAFLVITVGEHLGLVRLLLARPGGPLRFGLLLVQR